MAGICYNQIYDVDTFHEKEGIEPLFPVITIRFARDQQQVSGTHALCAWRLPDRHANAEKQRLTAQILPVQYMKCDKRGRVRFYFHFDSAISSAGGTGYFEFPIDHFAKVIDYSDALLYNDAMKFQVSDLMTFALPCPTDMSFQDVWRTKDIYAFKIIIKYLVPHDHVRAKETYSPIHNGAFYIYMRKEMWNNFASRFPDNQAIRKFLLEEIL